MMGVSHAIVASSAAAVVLAAAREHPQIGLPLAAGIVVGGLLPDVDSPGTFYLEQVARRWAMRRRSPLLLRLAGIAILSFVIPLRVVVQTFAIPHRGLLHSPLWVIALAAVGVLLVPVLPAVGLGLVGLGVGYAIHLMIDSLTPSGISWFGWHVRGPVRTGSAAEIGVVFLIVVTSACAVFALFQIR